MPPLIGYAAASGSLKAEAWALAAILFVWQFPHSLAIAWMYRDDYARAGIRMLPVIEPDGRSTARHIVAFASTLIPVSLIPVLLGMTGRMYLVGALVLGDTSYTSEFVSRQSAQTSVRDRSYWRLLPICRF